MTESPPTLPTLLTPKEAAREMGCSRSSVYTMMGDGRLPFVKDLMGRKRIRSSVILAIGDNPRPASIGEAA